MTYHYTMCGLDYVHLRSGYRTHKTEYGKGVAVEHADALDRVIAGYVVTSDARLRGQEVRFLRSLMNFSQAELALYLGIKRITVARWESAPNTPIPGPADRTIRIVAAKELYGEKNLGVVAELFPEIAYEEPGQLIMSYIPDGEDEPSLFPDKKREAEGWRKEKEAA